jgi:hypothetical protein
LLETIKTDLTINCVFCDHDGTITPWCTSLPFDCDADKPLLLFSKDFMIDFEHLIGDNEFWRGYTV